MGWTEDDAALNEYATTMGWVPENDDLLGVYDRVAFTVVDSRAVLELSTRNR